MQTVYQALIKSSRRHEGKIILGILGFPLTKTLSPVFQNIWLKKHVIELEYQKFVVAPQHLDSWWNEIIAHNLWTGLNVTAPYKQHIYNLLRASLTPKNNETSEVTAVNCVFPADFNLLAGSNTDWQGLLQVWQLHGWPSLKNDQSQSHRICLVFGAGGSAQAVAHAWNHNQASLNNQNSHHRSNTSKNISEDISEIFFVTRDLNLAEFFEKKLIPLLDKSHRNNRFLDLCWINASPLGWEAQDSWPSQWNVSQAATMLEQQFSSGGGLTVNHFAMDLNYPDTWQRYLKQELSEELWLDYHYFQNHITQNSMRADTLFLQQFNAIPLVSCLNGLPLLIEQGRLSFIKWFGKDPYHNR